MSRRTRRRLARDLRDGWPGRPGDARRPTDGAARPRRARSSATPPLRRVPGVRPSGVPPPVRFVSPLRRAAPSIEIVFTVDEGTEVAAARGRFALAWRLATATATPDSCSTRVHSRRRRSGKRASVRRRVSAMRQGGRTRVWFEPPSFDLIRSGFQSAIRARRAEPKLRDVSAIEPLAPSRPDQRGGASCRSATSHSSRASTSTNWSSSGPPAGGWARPWKRFQVSTRNTMPG